ncbi:hypothetical protein [Methanosarcina vacuolata]|uniref:RNA-binding proteins (RRM domain) n=1 Tax=Methanosarcina vacuolata Z-761 TaxID=1434123 RepID=A0A0E3Q5P1_9EURY|nr:hypothetical protein [Methanosarcina vacuolata]AKB43754.1 RNA-binding proteins (RRM domain) [Methanosarcina vacuolata Z-761]
MKLPLKIIYIFLIFALLTSCVAATKTKDLPTKEEITDFIAGIPVSDNYIITVFNAVIDKQPTWNCDIWVDKDGNQLLSLYYVDPDSTKGYGSIYFNELGKDISRQDKQGLELKLVKIYVGKSLSEETTDDYNTTTVNNYDSEESEIAEPEPEKLADTSDELAEESSTSVNFHGEKTSVIKGEDILLKLSAVNPITKPIMHVQAIIIPPSGMSVSSSEFVESGAGQYTTTYDLEPGREKDIEVRIAATQVGNFNVIGRVIYYFGENKKDAVAETLNLPIQVNKALGTQSSTLEDKSVTIPVPDIPGFGAASLIMMLMLAFLLRRN